MAIAVASAPDSTRLLTVVRHAKSSWQDAGQADFERGLNPRGRRDAPEMGRRLVRGSELPTLVVSSPARRTRQTVEALVTDWSPSPTLVWEPELYLASAAAVLDVVVGLDPEHAHAMVVGHNPGLTDFVNRFADAGVSNLPTCAVVRTRLWVPEWSDAGWGCATVLQLDTPKLPAA